MFDPLNTKHLLWTWTFSSMFQVQQLSKKEIEDLLRKGAYGALMDEEDEGSKFCEEDIDQILQRRTHTITIESEGKGSTFAKVPRSNLYSHSAFILYEQYGRCVMCVKRSTYLYDYLTLTIMFSYDCRPVLLQQGTEQTFLWRIQTSGRNGQRRQSWTWIPSMDG